MPIYTTDLQVCTQSSKNLLWSVSCSSCSFSATLNFHCTWEANSGHWHVYSTWQRIKHYSEAWLGGREIVTNICQRNTLLPIDLSLNVNNASYVLVACWCCDMPHKSQLTHENQDVRHGASLLNRALGVKDSCISTCKCYFSFTHGISQADLHCT